MYLTTLSDNFGFSGTSSHSNSDSLNNFVIKVFDINGRRIKTLITNAIPSFQELGSKLLEHTSGVYIVNAFSKDRFVKAFKYIKE